MSARDQMRSGVKVTATALCQWERTLQGGLRAAWRPGCRVLGGAEAGGRASEAAGPLTREQHVHAVIRSGGSARHPSIERWVSRGFIAALHLLIAVAEIAIVVRA
jgi:hypothetical protein